MYNAEIIERLQEKMLHFKENADTQRNRAEELRKAYIESKKQNDAVRSLMEEKEAKFN